MPLGLRTLKLRVCRIADGAVGAHQVELPAGLQAHRLGGGHRHIGLAHATTGADARIQLGQQSGVGGGALRAGGLHPRQCLGHIGADGLCGIDQFHQQRIALLLPPLGQRAYGPLVGQRSLPLQGRSSIDFGGRHDDGTSAECQCH